MLSVSETVSAAHPFTGVEILKGTPSAPVEVCGWWPLCVLFAPALMCRRHGRSPCDARGSLVPRLLALTPAHPGPVHRKALRSFTPIHSGVPA